jgi:hypothetical protein
LHSAPSDHYVTVAWDPTADDGVIGYAVYVGTASRQYDQVFLASNRTYFTYANAVPDTRYYFAVVAYSNSLVSGFSNEVSGFGQATPAIPVSNGLAARRLATSVETLTSSADRPCGDSAGQDCGGPLLIAATGASVDALAATGDGRLLLIEDGQRVRVLTGRMFLADAALVATPATKLVGIAVDPQFEQRRRVYVAEEERLADGRRELRIVRYREVQNTLGEGAAVVTGVRLPPTGTAAFTVDANGRIFIAVPSSEAGTAASGVVLGFDGEGRALQQNRSASPIVARGPAVPVAIGWDDTAQQLWLTGTDDGGRPTVVRIPVRPLEPSDAWPRIPESVPFEPVAPLFRGRSAQPPTGTPMLTLRLPSGGRLIRVDAGANEVDPLPQFDAGEPTATTTGPHTAAYVAVRSTPSLRTYIFRIGRP